MSSSLLSQKLKTKEEELKILYTISETISNNLDLDEVFKHLITIVKKVTKADSILIYLYEDEKLILRASSKPHPTMVGTVVLKRGEGITGWVAKNMTAVVLEKKAYQDPRFELVPGLPEDQYEAFLSMPIIHKKKVVGVINVQHRGARSYKKDEIRLFEIITKQVGGAIENAHLIAETHMLKDALETRKLIDRAKGMLMKQFAISEEEAYKKIHKKSMDTRKSMKEIAEAVILAAEMK